MKTRDKNNLRFASKIRNVSGNKKQKYLSFEGCGFQSTTVSASTAVQVPY